MNVNSSRTPGVTIDHAREQLQAQFEGQKATFKSTKKTEKYLEALERSDADFLVDAYLDAKQYLENDKILGMDRATATVIGGVGLTTLASVSAGLTLANAGSAWGFPLTLLGLGAGAAAIHYSVKRGEAKREMPRILVDGQKELSDIIKNPVRKEDSRARKFSRQQLLDGFRAKEGNAKSMREQIRYRDYADEVAQVKGETAVEILTQLPDFQRIGENLADEIRRVVTDESGRQGKTPAREIPVELAIEQLEKHKKGAHAHLNADQTRRAGEVIDALKLHPGENLLQVYEKSRDVVRDFERVRENRIIQAGLLAGGTVVAAFATGQFSGLGATAVALGGLGLAGQRILSKKEPENLHQIRAVYDNDHSILRWIESPLNEKDGKAADIRREELFEHLREQMVDATPKQVAARLESEEKLKKITGETALEMWESASERSNQSEMSLLTRLTKEVIEAKEE